jgi:hypothetical protein
MSGLRKLAKERSVGPAGAQKVSSSDISGCDFFGAADARPREEAAAGVRVFLSKGFSGAAFLLACEGRPDALAGVRDGSSSKFSACVFLKPVKARPRGEAVAVRSSFLPKGVSGDDFFLRGEGRSVAAPLAWSPAKLGLRVGFFLLTGKGSPRRKKGRK